MKITDVTTETYRWPRHKPISNGLHTYTHGEVSLVEVHTNEGHVGYGIGRPRPAERAFRDQFSKKLIGRDPLMTEAIWKELWSPKLYGRRGMETRALSSIDLALWDLRGKVAGLPVHRLVGGYRKTIPVYTAGGYYAPGKGPLRRTGDARGQDEGRGRPDRRGRAAGPHGAGCHRPGHQADDRRQLRLPGL